MCCVTASELESIKALFNEKEKELTVAVAKVEELTLQLEELRKGATLNGGTKDIDGTAGDSVSYSELNRLRKELMVSM